jgi:hypothetical protein
MKTSCFVAGIVKGLIEHGDPYKHFGSLGGYLWHLADAQASGHVDALGQVTDAGREWYRSSNLAALPNVRSYMWDMSKINSED